MKSGWRVGSLFGIPLFLDPSWFFILLFVTASYGLSWQREHWGDGIEWLAGLVMALLLFGSVLLHELGHSLIALSQGISVNSITLFLFGGIASIDQESKTPEQAFQVAIAGPAVSFGLFLVFTLVYQLLPLSDPIVAVAERLAWVNLVLAVFNMIPGLPLDGGQVLKAVIWKATGNRIKGVRWASRAGITLGWLAIALGLFYFTRYQQFIFLWIALLGWFGLRNATAYNRVTDLQEALLSLTAADVMTRNFRVVDADASLRQFADQYILEDTHVPFYFAASDGRYRGLVSMDDLRQTERSQWDTVTLQAIARPLAEIPSVQESTPLPQVVTALESQELRHITVLSPAGTVAGVLDRGDIVRSVGQRLKLPISDAMIRRIKDEGVYPPGLELPAIAKGLVPVIQPNPSSSTP
ncbi:MAG: site-2 protease family protein [Synechococcales bacterium]|nr:site-2 protease family protein [Synechococcales bacterium]